MNRKKILPLIGICAFSAMIFAIGCAKDGQPKPPIHDTVSVNKTDTLTDTDHVPDPTVDLKKGLLLYLPFSGNIADSSGNGNPTQAIGGSVLATDALGYSNSAFGATGNGERILVTNNGSIQFDTAFTVSLFFMINQQRTQSFLSLIQVASGNGPTFNMGTTLPFSPVLSMGVGDSAAGCDNIGGGSRPRIIDTTNFTPVTGLWYSLIGIYHKGSLDMYVNGKLIYSKTSSGKKALLCPASQFLVGAWWNNDLLSMNGKLDNIRMYNRVLTPHEIQVLGKNYQFVTNKVKPTVQIR
jgi:hypothetical protein